MKIKKRLLLYVNLLFSLNLSGKVPSLIRFVNTGKMAVAQNSGNSNTITSLYVPLSITPSAYIVRMSGKWQVTTELICKQQ